MKRRITLALSAVFGCSVLGAWAQTPLSFDVSLAPNTSGALEGSASLVLRWAGFAQSGLLFSADSFMEEYAEGGGVTTVIRATKTLDFEVFRLRDGFFGLEFPGGGASLSAALIANGALIDEDRYGRGTGYAYYQSQRLMWVKPLLGVDASARLGALSLDGHYRTSWPFELDEYVEGTAFYSSFPSEAAYSVKDRGFETRLGGGLSLEAAKGWTIRGSFGWIRHIGYAAAMSGGVAQEYVYEMVDMEGSLTLAFPVGSYRPLVGVALASSAFKPLELFSVEPYENTRWRFIFGLELY